MKDEIIRINNNYKKEYCSILINDTFFFKGNIIGISKGTELNLKNGDEILIEKADYSVKRSTIIDLRDFKDESVTIKLNKNIKKTDKFYKLIGPHYPVIS